MSTLVRWWVVSQLVLVGIACSSASDDGQSAVTASDSTDATDGATDATDGATDATDGATDATDGATDATDGATDATDGATDATDGATDATDGATDATDGMTDATDGMTDATDGMTDATDGLDETDGIDGLDDTDAVDGIDDTDGVDGTDGGPLPGVCGEYAGDECAEGEFCLYPSTDLCGESFSTGVCTEIPTDKCPEFNAPVCGCDGKLYDNECFAHLAGTSATADQSCMWETGTPCGFGASPCPVGQWCSFGPNDFCGSDAPGICKELPDVCEYLYYPVCGCDGVTYTNECEANAAGTSVAYEGECAPLGPPCGGIAGLVCPSGQFCSYDESTMCGSGDQTGVCLPKPPVCTSAYDPVCGCDGKLYDNECLANQVGTSTAPETWCDAISEECGGFLGESCGDGQFCNYTKEQLCGEEGVMGVCAQITDECSDIFEPVCGCDGNVYDNACLAAKVAVSTAPDTYCNLPQADPCGGPEELTCNLDEYCHYGSTEECGFAGEVLGKCKPLPLACLDLYLPVCGCDGEIYGNECEAHSNGVSVSSDKSCLGIEPPPGQPCGGPVGFPCAAGQYCKFEIAAYCGFEDAFGVCTVIPEECLEPSGIEVCACDGNTYASECEAAQEGTSVAPAEVCEL